MIAELPPTEIKIGPQAGKQTRFMSSSADIVFYGGGAGGGKTRGLLLDAVRHFRVPGYNAVIFRKTKPEIRNPGGLWDDSNLVYPYLGGIPRENNLDWYWPKYKSSITFSHLQYSKDREAWKGSQIPYIGWDEVTHHDESTFFYMLSRNRSLCGIRPVVRCTCNPEPGSWVASFLSWWIGNDGFPIPERDGVLRYFVRQGNRIAWGDTPEELPGYDPKAPPRSVTFIKSLLEDNPILKDGDPSYTSNLLALPLYERMILRDGNWKVRPEGGMRFKRHWFEIIKKDAVPPFERAVRYWDRASTEPSPRNRDPDWTAGVHMGITRRGTTVITDVRRFQGTPGKVVASIRNTAIQDASPDVTELWLEHDPGSAGVSERDTLAKELAEYAPRFIRPTGSKWVRSAGASAGSENGLIQLVEGEWNRDFLDELDAFVDEDAKDIKLPPGYHDDQVDSTSGAYNRLVNAGNPSIT